MQARIELKKGIFLSFFMVLLLCVPELFSAEIYRWTDEKGTVHLTDDPSKVPEAYSQPIVKIRIPEQEEKAIPVPSKPDDRSDRVEKYLKEMDQKIEAKRKLEKRMAELEDELASIEDRLRWIEQDEEENFQYYQPFRDPKSGRWTMVGSPYLDEKRELSYRMESIKKEMKTLEEAISKITRSL